MNSFGRYTLVRSIGRGGMAEIWKAKATGPSGFVKFLALKTILPDIAEDRVFVSMFVDEAKLEATLVHPNVIQVFDFGEIDGRLFLAMEYVAGGNVDRLLSRLAKRKEKLPSEKLAIFIALEAARGLGYAHSKKDASGKSLGIVHRDVSPHNILVSTTGEVKLGDFGIARAASAVSRTEIGQVRGKLVYMSPEQIDSRPLDARSDLFSLGVVLYEMLTGERLFEIPGVKKPASEEIASKIRRFDPMAHMDLARVPEALRDVLLVVLQHDRHDRFPDATALETELIKRLPADAMARARRELGALVARMFEDGITADAQDETGQHAVGDPVLDSGARTGLATVVEGSSPPLAASAIAEGTPAVMVPPNAKIPATAEVPPTGKRRIWPLALGGLAVVAAIAVVFAIRSRGPAAASHYGGTARIAMGFEAERFDLFSVELSRTRMTLDEVFEPLLRIGNDGEIDPWLLERTEILDDARRIVLHLRPDVWFHANPCLPGGTERLATAEDVVFTLQQYVAQHQLTLPIADIAVTGPLEVTMRMTSGAALFRMQLASVKLVPREIDGCEDLRRMKQPVGTGPFRFSAPAQGARMSLLRAPHSWRRAPNGDQLPYLDGVEIQPIDDVRDVMGRLARGQLDVAMPAIEDWVTIIDVSGPLPKLMPAYRNLGFVAATHTSTNRVSLFGLFFAESVSDVRIRRAVALGLDRAKLVAATDRLIGAVSGRLLSSRMLGFDASVRALDYQPDTARMLLGEAGHIGGKGVALKIGTIRDFKIGTALVEQLAELGIQATIVAIPPAKAIEVFKTGAVDALLITDQWQMYSGEVVDLVEEMLRWHHSDVIDGLQRKLVATAERADRAPIYKAIEEQLITEVPFVPIAWGDTSHPAEVLLVRERMHDFDDRVTGYGRLDSLANAWLD